MFSRKQRRYQESSQQHARLRRLLLIKLGMITWFVLLIGRLFYWQVVKGEELKAVAESQYQTVHKISAHRGKIFTSDGHLLVGNTTVYTLFAQPHVLTAEPSHIAKSLTEIFADQLLQATDSASEVKRLEKELETDFYNKLANSERRWIALRHRVTAEQKTQIEQLNFHGVGFDPIEVRGYPEASMAAHLTGFVGKDEQGEDQGYFGIEGRFNRELEGKPGELRRLESAKGIPLTREDQLSVPATDGRDIVLTIRRDLQFMLEEGLEKGIQKYGAVSGEAAIMDPKTGKILALASWPHYDQEKYYSYEAALYKNPFVSDTYEPGSTFKIVTLAAAIDGGAVSPGTACTRCAQARTIAGYTIKTWNDQYTANISMTDALAKSDNTAMIFAAEELGKDRYVEYLKKFQIGEKTNVELQEEASVPLRKTWQPIDLATASFGQGIALTGIQMLKAASAIANDGKMMKPQIVESVIVDGKPEPVQSEQVGQPISAQTARTVTQMMVEAAQHGDAKWTVLKKYTIAGKTGTAQIPVAGHYDAEKTMASFVGFAPAQDPQFVMLIKLREPKTSQWASETAAPLWYDIAQELFIRLNIPPDRE